MKVLTYNIHRGADSNNKTTLSEMGAYLKNMDCDIICLQEALYPQFKKLKSILKLDGVFAANVKKPGMLYGVCIFSKYEILETSHIFLSSKKEQRGLLSINIYSDGDRVNIINTHLGLDKYERYTQISEILDYTNRLSGKIVICGDFNEKNMSFSNFKDSAVIFNKYKISTFEKLNARIDYIFTSEEVNIKDYYVDCINLSDHYPVIGEM